MRVKKISIDYWQQFENLEFEIDEDLRMICLVGANGTGKTSLLELVATCAHKIGLMSALDISRGIPFIDQHRFRVQFSIPEATRKVLEELVRNPGLSSWDHTLIVESYHVGTKHEQIVLAGGLEGAVSTTLAESITESLRHLQKLYFLFLDADRAYPPKHVQAHELSQALITDFSSIDFLRNRSSVRSATLFDEWIKRVISDENRLGNELIDKNREALLKGEEPPKFIDPYKRYNDLLQEIMPHLHFKKIHRGSDTPSLLFSTNGHDIPFNRLSGGEREIAFLIGQIDKFRLSEGIFLLDEPELHLNSELIRKWVKYLRTTVETGQVWIATHSLEAVEAAGSQATFMLERGMGATKISRIVRYNSRPLFLALSRDMGTPAFSISKNKFVCIEGSNGKERQRFNEIVGDLAESIRFMESGGYKEVINRIKAIRSLAEASDSDIRIGGVLDQDLRPSEAIDNLRKKGVYILAVHEIENFFLHPQSLCRITSNWRFDEKQILQKIRDASDIRAGAWVLKHALDNNTLSLNDEQTEKISNGLALLKGKSWEELCKGIEASIRSSLNAFSSELIEELVGIIKNSVAAYRVVREEDEFWKRCEGKQVLKNIPRSLRLDNSTEAIEEAVLNLWRSDPSSIPIELLELRSYLESV